MFSRGALTADITTPTEPFVVGPGKLVAVALRLRLRLRLRLSF
jgi:hypothetical protein